MKKTNDPINKNTEKQMVRLLTEVCEQHKFITAGFSWLTHTLDAKRSANSLQIICVFDDQQSLDKAIESKQINNLQADVLSVMTTLKININSPSKLVKFSIEEKYQGYH
ncbi:hypothetical protein RI844_08460 [Thalassotalea fonticola]|uniref:Fis family transcriptional regulator n=1 Tax=Thalassotalea fonticola TaxID=3065649 RepID=A0ABZ0GTU9_9GAMM|nr:hypothetical protein RI844_08460 [Colwelliaceae bacterium S1-1]